MRWTAFEEDIGIPGIFATFSPLRVTMSAPKCFGVPSLRFAHVRDYHFDAIGGNGSLERFVFFDPHLNLVWESSGRPEWPIHRSPVRFPQRPM